jgi:hypothetical protein
MFSLLGFSRVPLPGLVLSLVVLLTLFLAGCSRDDSKQVAGVSSTVDPAVAALGPADPFSAEAPLRGEEVVPPVETPAGGLFRLASTGEGQPEFSLELQGLEEIIGVELRSGRPGDEGPLLATLFSRERGDAFVPESGRVTEDHLVGGKLEGEGLQALLSLLPTGETYIEVRTAAHDNGELRGQLMVRPGAARISEESQTAPADTTLPPAAAPATPAPRDDDGQGRDDDGQGRDDAKGRDDGQGRDDAKGRDDDKQRGPDKDDDKDDAKDDKDRGKGKDQDGSRGEERRADKSRGNDD